MSQLHTDIDMLHPKFRGRISDLAQNLVLGYETGLTKTLFKVFETYRDPLRQNDLVAKGVSKAGSYESAHQFGLAVDFVPWITVLDAQRLSLRLGKPVRAGWNWDATNDYSFLTKEARKVGAVVPISWDLCHVQHPEFEGLQRWMKYNL